MKKIMALDIGTAWTGTAISDPLGLLARPLKTLTSAHLIKELTLLLTEHRCSSVVIGLPLTMKGTDSDQTRSVREQYNLLCQTFPAVEFVLWDERLSSKRAASLKPTKSKEDKHASHSIAAAYILDSYLTFKKQREESTQF